MTDWKTRQNRDGGWGYGRGCSWTEPTALVLLAQSVTQMDRTSCESGYQFLRAMQREDGGLSPQAGVSESNWVTALATLLPESAIGPGRTNRAVDWLKDQTGRESGWAYKLRQRFTGNKDEFPDGWPWFPGTAAWVIPTSIGILAFERAMKRGQDAKLEERVEAGRRFLFSRMCADGGWNHGGNRALGRDGDSYPETTGIALLALHLAQRTDLLERAKTAARRHLETCRTAEGSAWLRMALAAHGENVSSPFAPVPRTIMDEALLAIADSGRNPLLS
jgi:hypothetical protein